MPAELWPYLVILVAGVLPNEVFRTAAVLLSRGIDEKSEIFNWIRIMATTLLAAVVSRLVYAPASALATVPIEVRIGSIAIGVAAYFGLRRALLPAILIGEAAFVGAAWWLGSR
jgi:hypothetical protein